MKKCISLLLVFTLLFTSCAEREDSTASAADTAASSSDTELSEDRTTDSSKDMPYPVTLNNYDREIIITAKPEKVLALGPNCAELLVALGLGDKIIGTSLRNHSRGPLPEYANAYEKLSELNHSSATREAVISSGADFIYGIDWEFGEEGLDIAELETYGIVTYMNAASTVEEQYQEIRDLGKIFEIENVAEAFVADQETRISAVQDKIADSEAPSVLVYDSGNDGVFTCSGVNFESLVISLAGGENIFADLTEKAWITVSYEEVLARDPDVIVIHDYDSPSATEKIAEIKANDMLSQLDSVKNEQFVIIELESVLPGNRLAYSIERLAAGFYPDKF